MHSNGSSTVKLKSNNNSRCSMYEIKANKSNQQCKKGWYHTLQWTRLLYIFTQHALHADIYLIGHLLLFLLISMCVCIWIILCLMYNHHYTLSCLYHSCFCGRLAYLSTSTCLNLCSNMFFFLYLFFSFSFLWVDVQVCLFFHFPVRYKMH